MLSATQSWSAPVRPGRGWCGSARHPAHIGPVNNRMQIPERADGGSRAACRARAATGILGISNRHQGRVAALEPTVPGPCGARAARERCSGRTACVVESSILTPQRERTRRACPSPAGGRGASSSSETPVLTKHQAPLPLSRRGARSSRSLTLGGEDGRLDDTGPEGDQPPAPAMPAAPASPLPPAPPAPASPEVPDVPEPAAPPSPPHHLFAGKNEKTKENIS